MTDSTPQNANEFIEQQLDDRAEALEKHLGADVLGFNGGLVFGVDDVICAVVEDIKRRSSHDKLVVVLTTLGGYIEIVERIAETFRHHYEIVDFVVPNHAFSAGTVLVMSGDAIYMNYYSRLGPIDPQVAGPDGSLLPALGYLIQWERLLEKASAGQLTTVEAQMMVTVFDQAALYKYEQARELSISLLKSWLVKYKFKDWHATETQGTPVTDVMKLQRAEEIARILNDTERWHSHGAGISMEVLREDVKLKIDDFDRDSELALCIKGYYNLLSDHMVNRRNNGALHIRGNYWPFM